MITAEFIGGPSCGERGTFAVAHATLVIPIGTGRDRPETLAEMAMGRYRWRNADTIRGKMVHFYLWEGPVE